MERLQAAAYGKIKKRWERQLSTMMCYRDEDYEKISQETVGKMKQANVLTNSGCESHFADLDNMIQTSAGGSSNLETFSQRHVIAKNKYLVSEDWKQLSAQEKRAKFRWARNSPQAKLVNDMAKDWLSKVQDSGRDIITKRGDKKDKKIVRSLKLLEQCKMHKGPLSTTKEDMELMETLNEKELLLEVSYIRCTLDSSIKQKRKIGGKFVKFSIEELKTQIRNCLLPTENLTSDLNSLLLEVIDLDKTVEILCESLATDDIQMQDQETSTSSVQSNSQVVRSGLLPGTTGWWQGPLGEEQIGVLLLEGSLQLYQKSRYGFIPDELPVNPHDWTIQAEIPAEKVFYITRRGNVFLRF